VSSDQEEGRLHTVIVTVEKEGTNKDKGNITALHMPITCLKAKLPNVSDHLVKAIMTFLKMVASTVDHFVFRACS
jgi:hypothetical protein